MAEIRFLPPTAKFFKKIKDKKLKKIFESTIRLIADDPTLGEAKIGDLAGIYCYDVYYSRINYEIAYTIEVNEYSDIVVIVMAGTRENFYNQLKKYIKSNSMN